MVNFYSCYVMECNERAATVEDVAGKLVILFCHRNLHKTIRYLTKFYLKKGFLFFLLNFGSISQSSTCELYSGSDRT